MNNIKDIVEREYSSNNKSYKITKIQKLNKNESKNIYSFIIGTSTLLTFNSLLKDLDLNNAVNKTIDEARDKFKYINLLETFTPRVWLNITSAALGLKRYVSKNLSIENYGPIDFLNIGSMSAKERGI